MAIAPERPRIYEGTRIPSPIPTVLQVPEELRRSEDVLTVNFGPNHPSTHGVLRLVVDLHGEDVVGLAAVVGYLHTGFEKNMEQKTWWKAITYPERIDYVSFQNNELVFVLAIEKLLGLDCGARMHTRYFQAGGLAEDIPRGFFPECRKFVESMPAAIDEYERILTRNQIWLERTRGIGLLSADDAIALGQSGPVLRASGVDWDLRRAEPYLSYEEIDFRVPTYPNAD